MQFGYIRISNFEQEYLAGFEEQKKQILEQYPEAIIIQEMSPDSMQRKSFDELIEKMEQQDILICTTLDRFCLDIHDGIRDINTILNKGCSVHILNMGLIDNTESGRIIMKHLLAFEVFQKIAMPERCQSGRIKAKQNPEFRDGRKPKYSTEQLEYACDLLENKTYQQVQKITGISNSTLRRYKAKKEAEK